MNNLLANYAASSAIIWYFKDDFYKDDKSNNRRAYARVCSCQRAFHFAPKLNTSFCHFRWT